MTADEITVECKSSKATFKRAQWMYEVVVYEET